MNLEGKAAPGKPDYFALAFGHRAEEELYDVVQDPYQLHNMAPDPAFGEIKKQMRSQLLAWMQKTGDPRSKNPRSTYWDELRFTPNYQMRDFDVQKNIQEYRIKPPSGPQAQNGIPCIPDLK